MASKPGVVALWLGRILTILPALLLIMSGVMKLMKTPQAVEGFGKFGYGVDHAIPIGIAEIACAVILLIPRTAVLGAILATGYLGGAVATHVRVYDPLPVMLTPAILGAVIWLGLLLRKPRLRAVLPFRR